MFKCGDASPYVTQGRAHDHRGAGVQSQKRAACAQNVFGPFPINVKFEKKALVES